MSEEILYIVSEYVQWNETIDLASTHHIMTDSLKICISNVFILIAVLLFTEKILQEKLFKYC